MSSEKFCLRWNDFESNISIAFRELRDDKDFFDVTIACDDEQIQAHKVILSACSPFFRNILRRNPHQHPLLYLKGVKYTDLQSVLNFMYQGEVNVAQEELNSFLAVAEDLKVKGLTQNQSDGNSQSAKSYTALKSPQPKSIPQSSQDRESPHPPIKRPRPQPTVVTSNNRIVDDDDIQEVVPVKTEPREPMPQPPPPTAPTMYTPSPIQQQQANSHVLAPVIEEDHALASYQEEGYDDYEQYEAGDTSYDDSMTDTGVEGNKEYLTTNLDTCLESFMVCEGSGTWLCSVCGNRGRKANVRRHVEARHMTGTSVTCSICGEMRKTRDSLRKHMKQEHSYHI